MIVRAAQILAGLEVAAGLVAAVYAGSLLAPPPGGSVPIAVHLAVVLVFGLAASWLIVAGRGDRRCGALGLGFLLIAASFTDGLAYAALAAGVPAALETLFGLTAALQIEALLPFSLWRFAAHFPRTAWFSPTVRLARAAGWLALGVGTLLMLANLALAAGLGEDGPLSLLKRSDYGLFWVLVFSLTLPVFPFMVWKAGQANLEERRRLRLFLAALGLGMGPLFLEVVLETLIPPWARFMERPLPFLIGSLLFYPLLLSIPFTTAYAVLVHKVLAVKLLVRRALQYLLARYVVLTAAAIPVGTLAYYLYRHRDEPIGELLAGGRGLLLALLSAVALAALRLRRPLLEAIDRRFFREQYDARAILADLVRKSRTADSPERLAEQLEAGIDQALHLHTLAVLTLDRISGAFVSATRRVRSLPGDSALATIAAGSPEVLEIDLRSPASALARLPQRDREWLADGAFELLLPLLASNGSALALIALGEKKSELPFSAEDRALLADIAASGALALENLVMLSSAGLADTSAAAAAAGHQGALDTHELARECAHCRLVFAPQTVHCERCSHELVRASVPYVVLGKFRLDRRLGAGGMGVVYRATDLVLGRRVAIKTLPRISPERSLRMRREARAMAAVSHPNLALIFGAETWHGTPMLVFELLEGGTLQERLERETLPPREVVRLGLELVSAVDVLHRAGILHRDIKPSNIGFTREGQVKLLDFGLARMLEEEVEGREPAALDPPGAEAGEDKTLTMTMKTAVGRLVGTPLYMSPEATAGAPPDPSFDLWGLALVLYLSLTGTHPFAGRDLPQTRQRILAARLPAASELERECPPALERFFARALHRQASRRPASARELRLELEQVRGSLEVAA